jgi:hypothetical protein
MITTVPSESPSDLLPDPNQPAFGPDGCPTPDTQRVLDITALQLSLLQYRVAKGRYPPALSDLFPDFAPADAQGKPLTSQPLDPETHKPYDYSVTADGSDYQLAATLSSGKRFTGSEPKTR